jgi:hypothetical protein
VHEIYRPQIGKGQQQQQFIEEEEELSIVKQQLDKYYKH